MNLTTFEIIQMILLAVAVPALFFVLIRAWNRDAKDIDAKNAERLKSTSPVQISAENRTVVKKNWLLPVLGAFFLANILIKGIVECALPFLHRKLEGEEWYASGGYKFVVIFSCIGVYVLGILGIVLWVFHEKRRLRYTANVVRIPAYVQSTFKNPKHYTKTAQLIFYDYKKNRFRMKTVSVDSYEKRIAVLKKDDFVWIAAEEQRGNVRFVSLLEDAPEREKEPWELALERLHEKKEQIEAMIRQHGKDGNDGIV